jgi:hypothetical protein
MKTHNKFNQNLLSMVFATSACLGGVSPENVYASSNVSFRMVPSAAVTTCLPKATSSVTISPLGSVENMHVEVRGLPPNTDFDFFVIQVPDKPFGLSWYQGDIETDQQGTGVADFTGRFNIETFIVAPGSDIAPVVHNSTYTFPDAATNPVTGPVHTFHLGLWFNSPTDAVTAGCPGAVTPFNGEHNAGIQVLNTSQFPKDRGPLWRLRP